MLALEAHRGHHQRTVAVQLTVDVAATVLTVPFTLLIEDVVQIRIGAQRGLLAQITLNISTARIGKRGKGEHGHVAELRIAATVIEDCLRGGGIKHSDLGQDRSGLLSRRGLNFGDFLGRLLDGLGRRLGLGRCLDLGSLRVLDVLGDLLFGGHSSLNLCLHRRDKAGGHAVKLANTGKRTLDILGAGSDTVITWRSAALARASRLGLG